MFVDLTLKVSVYGTAQIHNIMIIHIKNASTATQDARIAQHLVLAIYVQAAYAVHAHHSHLHAQLILLIRVYLGIFSVQI